MRITFFISLLILFGCLIKKEQPCKFKEFSFKEELNKTIMDDFHDGNPRKDAYFLKIDS